MKCPICNNHELVTQSLEDSFGFAPDLFCPEVTKVEFKTLNHYREFTSRGEIRVIVLPYRIVTKNNRSTVGLLKKYKTGERKNYFKTILNVPTIHLDTAPKLKERIKLLLTLS